MYAIRSYYALGGLAILLGVDRIPDMFRTSINALGQLTTAVLVDRWVARVPREGEGPPTDPDPTG